MRKKIIQKKTKKTVKKGAIIDVRFFAVSFGILVIVLAGNIVMGRIHNDRVLGAHVILAQEQEQKDSVQGDDTEGTKQTTIAIPEPTERPEPTDKPEKVREVENIQNEIKSKVENTGVKNIEISAPEESSQSGKVALNSSEGSSQELSAPVSNSTPVTQISTQKTGTVSIHVSGTNEMAFKNGPYTTTTTFPVVVDPKTQTLAVKTTQGVLPIKTFPLEMFQNMDAQHRLSGVSSLVLTEQQGIPVYQVDGVQTKKLLGIIPIQATVRQNISAENGSVISADEPWYFSTFGFAFQSI